MIKVKHKDGCLYGIDDDVFQDMINKNIIKILRDSNSKTIRISERIIRFFEDENIISSGLLRNKLRVDKESFDNAVKMLVESGFIRIEQKINKYKPDGYYDIVCIK